MPPKTRDKESGEKDNEQLNDIQRNVERILSMLASVDSKVRLVENKIESLDKKIETITYEAHNQEVRMEAQESRINTLETKVHALQDDFDLLQNRSRQNNLRILNIPEGEERGDLTCYVAELITEELKVNLTPADLEWCYRIGVKEGNARYPRMIVFKLRDHKTKVNILKAQGIKEVKIRGQTIRFVQDLSVRLRMRRRGYLPIRQELEKHGIKSQLRYPSLLWVWKGNKKMEFTSSDGALIKLKEVFPFESLHSLGTKDTMKSTERGKKQKV